MSFWIILAKRQPCHSNNFKTMPQISYYESKVFFTSIFIYVSVMIASSKFFYSLISDCTEPFIVNIYTDATADIATQVNRGVCFDYVQTPC